MHNYKIYTSIQYIIIYTYKYFFIHILLIFCIIIIIGYYKQLYNNYTIDSSQNIIDDLWLI